MIIKDRDVHKLFKAYDAIGRVLLICNPILTQKTKDELTETRRKIREEVERQGGELGIIL